MMNKTTKVFAEKGSKNVAIPSAAEWGPLVTLCCIISANGNHIPPAMVFPQVHFKNHMTTGAYPGTLGLATVSGWMNNELFIQVLQHFVHLTNCSESRQS